MHTSIQALELALNAIAEGHADAILLDRHDGTPPRVIAFENANLPYRSLLDAMSEGAAALSVEADLLYANPALCKLFGKTLHELVGKKIFNIFPEKCSDNLRYLIASFQDQHITADYECVDHVGNVLTVKLSLTSITNNGVITGYVVMIVDTSEYKKTIVLLEAERLRLAQAQKVAKIGSWETEIADMSVKWSNETHRIFETDPVNFHPTHQFFMLCVHPDDRDRVDQAFMWSLSQQSDQKIEHRLRMLDGRIKYIDEHWKVYFDKEGNPVRVFGTCQDITERKLSEEQIQHLAFYDALTELPNRRLLLDRLHYIYDASSRRQTYDAVFFIDLDNFKILNDTQGHSVGDLLLIAIAQKLKVNIRQSDTIGRLGGDEFIVIAQDLSDDLCKAYAIADKIGKALLNTISEPLVLNGHEYMGTASIGITLFCNQETTVDELLKRADTAMYQAKKAGRNTLRFYDPEMQALLETRSALESDLRDAISADQFVLFYQMQVDHAKKIHGAEALIRWPHPSLGLVPPMQFIPLAEETGLILPIGQWVLNKACAQIKAWENNPLMRHLIISVNVSARQFRQPDFIEQVVAAINDHGIDPTKLKLELTETLVLDNIDDTTFKMRTLKLLGIHFSLDDFGTGYSSLAYLTKLPLNELKIDRSFVHNIFTNEKDAIVVQTVIGMAKNLGIEVIAEGVETECQRAFLELHGCNLCQGYLFGKPVPLDTFESILLKQSLDFF